jgi:hypothetical protein
MEIRIHASTTLSNAAGQGPGVPLWQLVPTHDSAGSRWPIS